MISQATWLRIAGSVFGVVAILHLLRILTGIPVLIGDFMLPVWINWAGMLATSFLCFRLWNLSARRLK